MLELTALGLLAVVAVMAFAAGLLVLKALLWLVLLPLRLVIWLVMVPLLLLKLIAGAVVFLVIAPIVGVALLAGVIALAVAVIVPLAPLVLLVALLWSVTRAGIHAVAAS